MTVWAISGHAAAPTIDAPAAPGRALRPIVAALVIAVGLIAVWAITGERAPGEASSPIRSLAVLPLDDPGAGEDEAYFSFGMTEALISELAKVQGLRVISRQSVTPYEGTEIPIREIAAQLGVDGIIEGSILRSGKRVRITAQLIDARTDSHIWAESYDRDLGDVLPLQAEVAREIARRVKLKVLPETDVASGASRSMSPEAYEAYLKGYYFQMKRTREDTVRALRYFHEVIRLEPDHPLGYSGLADEYSCVPTHSWSIVDSELWPSVPSEMIARARTNAEKAVELDPYSGAAHNSLALVSAFGDWNFEVAEAEFLRALELSPSSDWSHFGYSQLLAVLRRFDEARVHLNEARALNPLRVDYAMTLAELHIWTGDPEQAYRLWNEAEEIDPSYPGLHQGVITGFCNTEQHDKALAALLGASLKYPNDPLVLAELAYCHAVTGDAERARELLAQVDSMSDSLYVSHVSRAMVHVGLGEHDAALKELQKGVRERDFMAVYLGIEPLWNPLREDPRFVELLATIGLLQA